MEGGAGRASGDGSGVAHQGTHAPTLKLQY